MVVLGENLPGFVIRRLNNGESVDDASVNHYNGLYQVYDGGGFVFNMYSSIGKSGHQFSLSWGGNIQTRACVNNVWGSWKVIAE